MRRIQQPLVAAINGVANGGGFALALADEICGFTPFGVFATKQAMWANLDVPSLESGIQLENRSQIMAGASGETEGAARAFFEKREPRWSDAGGDPGGS